jgi:hypothetical protein
VPAVPFASYYQDCISRWSGARYALDKRFVHLTLLLDQGEDAQGPRWQPAGETFSDLRDALARVPNQAIVVLGPCGCGKPFSASWSATIRVIG